MKKFFSFGEKAEGFIPKVEKVARAISFVILLLDTLRFFHKGLQEFTKNEKDTQGNTSGDSAAGAAA